MAKKLSEKAEKFISSLFDEELRSQHTVQELGVMAGYSEGTNMREITRYYADEIVKMGAKEVATDIPSAVLTFRGIMADPSMLGASNALNAAKEVMDRGGVAKQDRIDINIDSKRNIIIIPEKKTEDEDEWVVCEPEED